MTTIKNALHTTNEPLAILDNKVFAKYIAMTLGALLVLFVLLAIMGTAFGTSGPYKANPALAKETAASAHLVER